MFVYILALVVICVDQVLGHGMVLDPPNRSSMWRFDSKYPPNYDDDGLFCGGFAVQYEENGGKCGLCGDAYNLPTPRPNEDGGYYGTGDVIRVYQEGSVIRLSVKVTAAHKGYFLFSICDLDSQGAESEECFDRHPLVLADGSDKFADIQFNPQTYAIDVKLPPGLTCERCVLRWHYRTGNSWGTCDDGSEALGCGDQEIFRTCSDISIVG